MEKKKHNKKTALIIGGAIFAALLALGGYKIYQIRHPESVFAAPAATAEPTANPNATRAPLIPITRSTDAPEATADPNAIEAALIPTPSSTEEP